ncbi:MAG: putative nucleotide-diphospho-sugar transferase [Pseudomonadota bacterium]
MDGVIYVAVGPEHRALARQSRESLGRTNPGLAADLFTDCACAIDHATFDRIHPVPDVHARAKLDCLAMSRFERTLYLDCDTLVLAAFGDLFEVAERFDLALAHDVRRRSALVQEGLAESTPYAFPQLNSGVMLYRLSPATRALFSDWARAFREAGVARDQVVLKDLLWASDLRFYVLPPEFNLRRVTMFDAWEPLDARPTILHSHRLKDHLAGAEAVASLDRVLELERAALLDEWRVHGLPRDRERAADEVLRVLLADVAGAG